VVHPGPPGDQGPAALDWALLDGATEWGVTVLQATGDYDAGPVWASRRFALRPGASKANTYRHEVVQAAVLAVQEALALFDAHRAAGRPHGGLPAGVAAVPGSFRPAPTQAQRRIEWAEDDAATVLRKLRAADSSPGVADALFGQPVHLFDGHAASAADRRRAPAGAPGAVVARRGPALLRRCGGGEAVWIGHVRRAAAEPGGPTLKLAATRAFAAEVAALPELEVPLLRDAATWDELHYAEHLVDNNGAAATVGVLRFDFHNGAMSTRQCRRLLAALREVAARPAQVLVLAGGPDFFSNGIHLHEIEATQLAGGSAADASMANIEAIDDVALAILQMTDRIAIAALRGNAGAGGCFLALAADEVWAHGGVVQNPHYKNMGNLHGSEYWTYLLPRRIGAERARALTQGRLPLGARQAAALGLVDAVLGESAAGFDAAVLDRAAALALDPGHAARIAAKAERRAADESAKPLAAWRAEELRAMQRNFYGFDPSYHVARHHFVHRKPHAWTPRHLAMHRALPSPLEPSSPPT
jgi:putative two-component system hydrogenase maturation factor HypX/HoxX